MKSRFVTVGATLVVLVCVLISSAAAGRRRFPSRTVEVDYSIPAISVLTPTPAGSTHACSTESACYRFDLRDADRYMTLEVNDDVGEGARVYVHEPHVGPIADFCGSSTQTPIDVGSADVIDVYLSNQPCVGQPPPTVTSGTLRVTFSRATT